MAIIEKCDFCGANLAVIDTLGKTGGQTLTVSVDEKICPACAKKDLLAEAEAARAAAIAEWKILRAEEIRFAQVRLENKRKDFFARKKAEFLGAWFADMADQVNFDDEETPA